LSLKIPEILFEPKATIVVRGNEDPSSVDFETKIVPSTAVPDR
jgi:hypothetical protein